MRDKLYRGALSYVDELACEAKGMHDVAIDNRIKVLNHNSKTFVRMQFGKHLKAKGHKFKDNITKDTCPAGQAVKFVITCCSK